MDPDKIRELIQQGLEDAEVQVTGDGTHFEALVVTEAFAGKSLIARHRMVYGTLGERMQSEIHALSMRTFTPQEWAEQRG